MLDKVSLYTLALKACSCAFCLSLFSFYSDTTRFLISFVFSYLPFYLLVFTRMNRKLPPLSSVYETLSKGSLQLIVVVVLLGASIE